MSQPANQLEAERELRLAEVLGRISDDPPDWNDIAIRHPDLVDELRQLHSIARLAQGAANKTPQAGKTHSQLPEHGEAVDHLPPAKKDFAGFELIEEIGRGAMGVVYKAWDSRLRRFVALKLILRGEHASKNDLERFRGEAQAAAGLTHANIVPVYGVGEHNGQAYFCMQFVQGANLSRLIDKEPLPSRRAARYLAAISSAVHHAHEQGILHRDLKPSNVLINAENDEPLVTDFGLAKRVQGGASLTGTGALVGTPSYMAPEQASGSGGNRASSDIYSLGASMYEMLTGRPPFQAASVVDVLLQVRGEDPVRPRLLNPSIDPDLELICLKCLEKNPEHRYATAQELADDLERFLNSEPVQARTSSLAYFIGRLFRETHHAPVMENWGKLWMLHSLKIFLLCAVTNAMYLLRGQIPMFNYHLSYITLWGTGLVIWGIFFWNWRRQAGPVLFVERQVAHAWAAGVIASIGTFVVEVLLYPPLPVLTLTPVLSVMAGMVFLFKAGTLTGWFYVAAGLCFLAAIPMALVPNIAPLLFGIVSGIGFFVPGLQYYRRKIISQV